MGGDHEALFSTVEKEEDAAGEGRAGGEGSHCPNRCGDIGSVVRRARRCGEGVVVGAQEDGIATRGRPREARDDRADVGVRNGKAVHEICVEAACAMVDLDLELRAGSRCNCSDTVELLDQQRHSIRLSMERSGNT